MLYNEQKKKCNRTRCDLMGQAGVGDFFVAEGISFPAALSQCYTWQGEREEKKGARESRI